VAQQCPFELSAVVSLVSPATELLEWYELYQFWQGTVLRWQPCQCTLASLHPTS
jgi:hypothetical protein